jgi:hypothetical protein
VSGGAPLNPYESPVIPAEESFHFDELGLVATFFMEVEDQQASVEVVPVSVSPWLLMTGGLGIAAAVGIFVYATEWFASDEIIVLTSLFSLFLLALLGFVQYFYTRLRHRQSMMFPLSHVLTALLFRVFISRVTFQ